MTNVKNILFFGDSLTAGYGLGNHKTESFPALIQQKIDVAGLPYHCINGGLSGDTTAGGLKRLEYWVNRPLHVFVLELGVNDIIRGISPQTTAKNIQTIVDKVKLKYPGIILVMLGMEVPAFIPGTFAVDFKAIFRSVADANQMAFVPFYLDGVAGKTHLNLPDGLHPNAAGYKVMADSVWPVLKALL